MSGLAQGLGWLFTALGTCTVATVLGAVGLYKAATADADFALLRKGKHKAGVFAGKVVWITGASQGLGKDLALYLSAQGARLILSSRSSEKLEAVKAACVSAGSSPGSIVVLPFDLLAGSDRLQEAAAAADAAFGGAGVDYLIHNAGASQHALVHETTDAVAQQLMELNALGPIKLTQAMLPHMLSRHKGRLVVISSMAAKVPSPGQAIYSGSKMAVWGYFASLATELADKGIGVTIVCPGPVATGVSGSRRVLFGPTGLIERFEVPDKSRMPPARAVQLIANAMAAGVEECWLAHQPVLLVCYLMQYFPPLAWFILKRIGPKRAKALSSGKSGYDMRKFMSDDGPAAAGGIKAE